ncbi:KICSTOR subunit 2-like isoform X3 [Amphibalanus amphitrite]|uniref:KICSTOR subunit 2-like isoform X3 n=1 Tax=Amphibalanus amphitrite TaxID=1232801 RepID=UPI001C909590|nr:KICSTOR subunit 2-like isoform X3 [Amphibalanus amphitrite]XP_043191284.1 KICSTOR subunit 2-like isoform X3 [Amphibalanus amphitrite]XP_043236256.1 KICSTOR subunit 2-like isoform X3 [Amphibalanus amphitrite]
MRSCGWSVRARYVVFRSLLNSWRTSPATRRPTLTTRTWRPSRLWSGENQSVTGRTCHQDDGLLVSGRVTRYEVRTLLSMLRTQEQLETWQFLPALMSLNEAHTHLNKFSACVQSRETRRLLFRRASQEPELIQWLQRLRAALVATFSLYFREVLSAQSSGSEFKALCAKTAADHFARLQSFQRKMDAALVALAFDGTEEAVRGGLGYRHPEQRVPPAGQHPKPYPAVLCCSKSDVQAALWPEVVAALAEPKLELSSSRVSHAWLGPSAAQSAFFLAISDCLTLVVVFDGRRSEKDSYVTSFMLETAAALRCSKIYHSLRPGAK